MTAPQYADAIRRVRWDHFEGRLTFPDRQRREDRLWDRAYDEGGRELVQAVEAALKVDDTTRRTA